uniref:Uncharacterized protein n=1 Tax=Panagrellus redivivus TaxID=6233 RepID=A0A7E4VEI2_PANRE
MSLLSSLLERLKKRGIISQPEPQVEVFVEDKSTEETADDDLKTRGGAPGCPNKWNEYHQQISATTIGAKALARTSFHRSISPDAVNMSANIRSLSIGRKSTMPASVDTTIGTVSRTKFAGFRRSIPAL